MNKKLSVTNLQREKNPHQYTKGYTTDKYFRHFYLPSPQKGTADNVTGLMP